MTRRAGISVVTFLATFMLCAGAAAARKPIVAYVDATTHKLALFDTETGSDLVPPDITTTSTLGFQDPMAMSFSGRYVFYVGADDKLHLFDRSGAGRDVPLPGIDIYAKPTGLSVSDNGLLAFDDNVNGPARVYDSTAGSFVNTGLDDMNNRNRQSHLSGDGHFLATTCNSGAAGCPQDSGGQSQLFVQDLTARTDTANPPFDLGNALSADDKEHPCINGDGSLVGADVNEGGAVGKQIEVYDRTAKTLLALIGLNSAGDDVHCVMSADGAYIGLISGTEFKVYDRASGSFLTLPPQLQAIFNPISFVAPYPPASPGGPGGSSSPPPGGTQDRTPPRAQDRFGKRYALRRALAHGLAGTLLSNELGSATATAFLSGSLAKHLGLTSRARPPLKVAAGSVRLVAGRRAKLKLAFTRKARRRLAKGRRVPLTIKIVVKDGAGNATRLSTRTTLVR